MLSGCAHLNQQNEQTGISVQYSMYTHGYVKARDVRTGEPKILSRGVKTVDLRKLDSTSWIITRFLNVCKHGVTNSRRRVDI